MPSNEVLYSIVPVICHGLIVERNDKDRIAGFHRVTIYDSPKGPIPNLAARLACVPGCENNFKIDTNVLVLIPHVWNIRKNSYDDSNHFYSSAVILGAHVPSKFIDIDNKNPNRDIEGDHVQYIHPESEGGMVVEKNGAVRLVTNGKVVSYLTPRGVGVDENANFNYAQNFHRIISNMEPFYVAREYFGYYIGQDPLTDRLSNIANPNDQYICYKRFVPQCRQPDVWVSTNEGTYNPWVGTNNEYQKVAKLREIIYSKVINYKQNRITITAGQTGPGFYTFRIDKTYPQPIGGEKLNTDGTVTPVRSETAFYLGISEDGELQAEFGVMQDPVTKKTKPAAILTVTKSGEVDLSVGKAFTINGKRVITEDFVKFMQSHQADLVQVTSVGAPAPMSASAAPDFIKGQKPGNFLTDQLSNTLGGSAPSLEST